MRMVATCQVSNGEPHSFIFKTTTAHRITSQANKCNMSKRCYHNQPMRAGRDAIPTDRAMRVELCERWRKYRPFQLPSDWPANSQHRINTSDQHLACALVMAHERDASWVKEQGQVQGAWTTPFQAVETPTNSATTVAPYPAHTGNAEQGLPLQIEVSSVISGARADAMESIPNPPIPGEPSSSLNEPQTTITCHRRRVM